jgi:multicomponent Na+:H+ antiporter subunit C
MSVQLDAAVLAGVLFAIGIYLVLDRGFLRVLFGFITLSNAANVLIFGMAGDPSGRSAPVITPGAPPPVDPLPQALVLTAIVIGFGILAYLTLLLYRMYVDRRATELGKLDADITGRGDGT